MEIISFIYYWKITRLFLAYFYFYSPKKEKAKKIFTLLRDNPLFLRKNINLGISGHGFSFLGS